MSSPALGSTAALDRPTPVATVASVRPSTPPGAPAAPLAPEAQVPEAPRSLFEEPAPRAAVVSLVIARLLSSLLYGVTPTDPATYGGVAALMSGIVLLASAWPAWRATRVDPIRTLKAE